MSKRGSLEDNDENNHQVDGEKEQPDAKRSRPDQQLTTLTDTRALVNTVNLRNASLVLSEKAARPSALSSPELHLTGHEGAIYSIDFDVSGQHLCSGSMDHKIFLWEVFGENKNYNVLAGHKSAVLQVKWRSETSIASCSADKTVAIWDANKGQRVRKLTEHTGIVNSCAVVRSDGSAGATNLLASGSDDCTAILWDARSKQSISTFYHDYQVCAVALSPDGQYFYTGGIDNVIRRFDTRMPDAEADLVLKGHADTVTGLSISPDGNHLLSNSMDSSLRVWDVRPFALNNSSRCERIMSGVHHGAEKLLLRCAWSPDQEFITAGSADRIVHLWDTNGYKEVCGWPGHKASVNEVIIHPNQPIIASCSSDKSIILGEFSI